MVVIARINLEGCLDLLNPRWQQEVGAADFDFVFECENSDSGKHARDAATINWYCDRAAATGDPCARPRLRHLRAALSHGDAVVVEAPVF